MSKFIWKKKACRRQPTVISQSARLYFAPPNSFLCDSDPIKVSLQSAPRGLFVQSDLFPKKRGVCLPTISCCRNSLNPAIVVLFWRLSCCLGESCRHEKVRPQSKPCIAPPLRNRIGEEGVSCLPLVPCRRKNHIGSQVYEKHLSALLLSHSSFWLK